jgi:hypothetical protein
MFVRSLLRRDFQMCCKMKCRGISDDEELIDFLKVLNTRYIYTTIMKNRGTAPHLGYLLLRTK